MIRHFFTANSRHGTHSPFVYDLASRIIYPVSRVRPATVNAPADFYPPYRALLLAILDDMDVKELAHFGASHQADALLVDLRETSAAEIKEVVRQGKIVVVHEPIRTRYTKRVWQRLIQSEDVVVSINLFHVGLLIQREGQRKENFRLRYPFWKTKKPR